MMSTNDYTPAAENDYGLTDEEIDAMTEPIRKNVAQGTSGRWIIDAPLLDVVTALGEACERIVAARLDAVETVLIENRRGTTNQPWLWDKVFDALRTPPGTTNGGAA